MEPSWKLDNPTAALAACRMLVHVHEGAARAGGVPTWDADTRAAHELAVVALGPAEVARIKAEVSAVRLYRCADPACPGRPYRASDQPHTGCKR